jgi:prepilin-type processing-associated H-X9-DG protein
MLQSRSYRSLSDPQPERLVVLYEIGKYGPSYDRHRNGMHIGHADGHAKWYQRDRMTPGAILSGIAPSPPVL